jgi:hypothetical protein
MWNKAVLTNQGTILAFAWIGLRNPLETLVGIASAMADIQTYHFLNMYLEC